MVNSDIIKEKSKDVIIEGANYENNLFKQLQETITMVEILKDIINKNSGNSSKPPSTDNYKNIFNGREKNGKSSDG